MKQIEDYTISELLAEGYVVEFHSENVGENSGKIYLHIEKPEQDGSGKLFDMNYKLGVRAERERFFTWLKSKGALRESILGDHMLVLYTEQGAIDITRKEFLNESE